MEDETSQVQSDRPVVLPTTWKPVRLNLISGISRARPVYNWYTAVIAGSKDVLTVGFDKVDVHSRREWISTSKNVEKARAGDSSPPTVQIFQLHKRIRYRTPFLPR